MTTDTVGRATARRGLMLVVLAAALWGTSGVATKTIYTLVDISPITVAAFRLALGAPMLLAAFRLTSGQRSFRVARTDLAWMLLAGAALGMSQACYFAAIARVGVAIATLVTICTAPVLVCLFSAALLRERLTRAVVGSLACALIGTVLLIGVGRTDSGLQASAALGGIALALAAAFGFAGLHSGEPSAGQPLPPAPLHHHCRRHRRGAAPGRLGHHDRHHRELPPGRSGRCSSISVWCRRRWAMRCFI